MKLLVVEDEIKLSSVMSKGLRKLGYAVDCAYDGLEALELFEINEYDLVLLDLNLPKMNGLSVLSEIRKRNRTINIIILSARDDISDKIQGLDAGANDYITKPFDFLELDARIRALLRREFNVKDSSINHGDIKVDMAKRIVYLNEEELKLTKKEYSILEYFMINKEKVITAEELIEHVWDSNVELFSNALKVQISSLRKKIGLNCIETVRGHGYRLIKE